MSYVGKGLLHGSYIHNSFSGDGSTVNFTLSTSPGSANALLVMVDNVLQSPSAFSVSGTTLTFTSAPSSGTNNIRVWIMGRELDIGKPAAGTVGATEMENGRYGGIPRVVLANRQTDGTSGGSVTAATWVDANINSEEVDSDGLCSTPASNQFTLQAGTWRVTGWVQGVRIGSFAARLYNVSDSVEVCVGTSAFSSGSSGNTETSRFNHEFTLADAKTLKFQIQGSVTNANGQGYDNSISGVDELYHMLTFEKVS